MSTTEPPPRPPPSSLRRTRLPRWIWPFVAAAVAILVHFWLSVPRGPMDFVKPDDAAPPTSDGDELPRIPPRPTAKRSS